MTTSLSANKAAILFQSFMPVRKEIKNAIGIDLYDVHVYDDEYFKNFSPHNEFVKWAAVEVSNFDTVPPGMETITIPGGQYAIFLHKGPASEGPVTYQHIFGSWLPTSAYTLDSRPHFSILGEKYKHHDPASEEEIWIPVREK
jgi:AraC family transcriptional regulator